MMKRFAFSLLAALALSGCAVRFHPELDPQAQEGLLRKQVAAADDAGRRDGALATALNNLGEICRSTNRTAEAEKYYLRSIEVESALPSPNPKNLAISYDNLVVLYSATKAFSSARDWSAKALTILDRDDGIGSLDLAVALSNRGMLEVEEGRFADAEPFLLRSVSILERPENVGSWQRKQALENLKQLYERSSRQSDAADVQRRLDEIAHKKRPA